MPEQDHKIQLVFIINGQEFAVEINPRSPLKVGVHRALIVSENTGRAEDEWEVRDVSGALLEQTRSVQELGLRSGARLFLSLRVGAGGFGLD